MKILGKVLLYILTCPAFLGWLFPLLMVAFCLAKDLRYLEQGVLAATWREWAAKHWKFSTTLSRGMVFHPMSLGVVRTQKHELVHVRQVEDNLLLALILTLILAYPLGWWALFIWVSGLLWQLPNFLTAVMRGGHIYFDVEHERSAYAQTDIRPHREGSWLDDHEAREQKW